MKTIMTINQYKKYKNNEIGLLDIKLQNIGLDRSEIKTDITTYIIENKRLIITLAIVLSGFIASDIVLSGLTVNALEYKPEICIDLFSINNSGVCGI